MILIVKVTGNEPFREMKKKKRFICRHTWMRAVHAADVNVCLNTWLHRATTFSIVQRGIRILQIP